MVAMERGQELHIRSCHGETLSSEERAELESWYAEMDAEEARTLRVREVPSTDDLRALLEQVIHELQQISDEEELTLIIPGKLTGRRSFDEVFGPLQKGFEESGLTEEEITAFVDAEMQRKKSEERHA